MTAPSGRYLDYGYTEIDFRATGKGGSAAIVFRKTILEEVGSNQYQTENEEFYFMEIGADGQALTGAQLIKHNWAGGAWHDLKIYRPFWTGSKWFIPYISIDSNKWVARAYLAMAPSSLKTPASPSTLKQKLIFSAGHDYQREREVRVRRGGRPAVPAAGDNSRYLAAEGAALLPAFRNHIHPLRLRQSGADALHLQDQEDGQGEGQARKG